MGKEILIVDDEADIRDLISGILSDEGFETRVAADADEALAQLSSRLPSLIVLDIWLQGSRLDGLELLDEIKHDYDDLPVVIISGHGNIETAVAAIKKGAYDFVEKPFQSDKLLLIVDRAIENARLKRENEDLALKAGRASEMIGNSPALNQVRSVIRKAAPTNSRVLVTGPSGAGKEVVARALHAQSTRAEEAFVVVNAASMAPERMEVELFGVHAHADDAGGRTEDRKVGLFEQAHGGTLYIDEIAEMPAETQSKILRVLIDQSFERVGGGPKIQVDVRVISSSSRNLREEIERGKFREDLYHRLNVVPIHVPGLEQRREDIGALVDYFLETICLSSGLPRRQLGEDAVAYLQAQDWPGNVRQLRNVIERLLILGTGDPDTAITREMVADEMGPRTIQAGAALQDSNALLGLPLRDAREQFERDYLFAQIDRFGGNISRTATFIGMERSALHRKIKALGMVNGSDGGGAAEAVNGATDGGNSPDQPSDEAQASA